RSRGECGQREAVARARRAKNRTLERAPPSPFGRMTEGLLMAYDLEEQDQLEDLKAWWKQWGNTIAGVIIAVSVGVIAVQGWRWWTQQQAMQAAVIYDAVNAAVRANDAAKAKDAMSQLAAKFPDTGYAPRAALLVAAQLFENGDPAGAKA